MSKLKFFISLSIVLLLFKVELSAETSPFQYLRFHSSARSAALAGCFVSMPEDPNAVFFNPATIYTVDEKPFSSTFVKNVLDINAGLVTYTHEFEKNGGKFAGAIGYTNYGAFDKADKYGNITGSFGANDLTFQGSYANELDSNLYYGVSAKILFVNIEKASSFAFAVDAGLLYQFPDGRSNAGLSILHAGSQLTTLDGVHEALPLDIRMGINHRLRGLPLLVNASFHHLADKTNSLFDKFKNFSLGGELYIGGYVMLRLGYDNQIRNYTSLDSDKKFSGFSGGAGLKLENFNFDYGMSMMGSSATMHRFSIGMNL